MNKPLYIGLGAILTSIGILYFVMTSNQDTYSSPRPHPTPVRVITSASPTPIVDATPSASPTPTATPTEQRNVYYPMTNYNERITNRDYGTRIVESDRDPLPCGSPFTGLHTGDDLEVTESELNTEMPVYAIAEGEVLRVSPISGYGGLVIIKHTLDGQVVNAYYGHIDLSQTTVEVGDSVKAGQKITILGEGCSPETSGERKHLHFSIRDGTSIDVKGYVDTQEELDSWIDPTEILTELGAREPL